MLAGGTKTVAQQGKGTGVQWRFSFQIGWSKCLLQITLAKNDFN